MEKCLQTFSEFAVHKMVESSGTLHAVFDHFSKLDSASR